LESSRITAEARSEAEWEAARIIAEAKQRAVRIITEAKDLLKNNS
jgi:F0F1-type ATP synthase membrane subunit b/b'